MNHKTIGIFILIWLTFQCSVAYAIDTDENEIVLGANDIPNITRIYSHEELEACIKLNLIKMECEDNIFNVKELMCMPNIEELYVEEGVHLDDYRKIQDFQNLRILSLPNQNILDISFVAHLTNLEEIDFSHNLIQDIDPLKQLEHLQIIDLSYNNISDISALKNEIELTELSLDFNKNISDLQAISFLNNVC